MDDVEIAASQNTNFSVKFPKRPEHTERNVFLMSFPKNSFTCVLHLNRFQGEGQHI